MDRKSIQKKSSKNRVKALKSIGMEPINTFVKKEVKDKLIRIQKTNGYKLIGDAIDDVTQSFSEK
ncbi:MULTISPECIES: hypothetical protein [Cysteiniphilum]|uniref:Uncharacterized protein n=1 Tax=Cysteiniphilum litorale TaxID=2056700 RepID=A0A8J2Z2Y8_9GAMM|nr:MULTISPECIES: hypothetical protein [Cysteiniphilum]GGF92100.1 hypothetical protein GCM10010995_06580 [Cysteiniphilum litorale]